MPVTEIVLLSALVVAYIGCVSLWITHCIVRMETAHPWIDPMPAWRRLAYDPTLAFAASLPALGGLILLGIRIGGLFP